MDALIAAIVFTPLVVLIWILVRYAGRIRHDAVDKELRTQHLDNLNPALVRFVLERDRHTCQRCGTKSHVGVDLIGATPDEGQEIHADDLEATCTECFSGQWSTLRETPSRIDKRDDSDQV